MTLMRAEKPAVVVVAVVEGIVTAAIEAKYFAA